MQHRPPALVADVVVDQLFNRLLALFGGSAACFFAVLRLATLMVAHQGAKSAGGHSILLDGGGRGCSREIAGCAVAMAMVLPVDPSEETRAVRCCGRGRRYRLQRRKCSQKIGAADNSDDATVAHHRHTLDAMCRQQAGDLADFGFFADRNDGRCHDVACGALLRPQLGEEIRAQIFALRQHCQPPVAPGFAIAIVAANQIALADHTDRHAAGVDDRNRADALFKQEPGDLAGWGVGADRNHLGRHYVFRIHALIRNPFLAIRGASTTDRVSS